MHHNIPYFLNTRKRPIIAERYHMKLYVFGLNPISNLSYCHFCTAYKGVICHRKNKYSSHEWLVCSRKPPQSISYSRIVISSDLIFRKKSTPIDAPAISATRRKSQIVMEDFSSRIPSNASPAAATEDFGSRLVSAIATGVSATAVPTMDRDAETAVFS